MDASEFIRKLNSIEGCVEERRNEIDTEVYSIILGEFRDRIFLEGKATDGSLITSKVKAKNPVGAYSKGHARERRRRRKGRGPRFIDKVDLFLTGKLRDSIIVDDGIAFKDDKQRKLAGYHEEYRKQDIFKLSEEEIELVRESVEGILGDIVQDCLR